MKGFEPRSSLHKADAVTTARARLSHLFCNEQSHGKFYLCQNFILINALICLLFCIHPKHKNILNKAIIK
jgi:hypothetical protein